MPGLIQFDPNLLTSNPQELKTRLRDAIKQLGCSQLPLQQGLSASSVALDDGLDAMIINITDQGESLLLKAGIFYKGIVAGCSCAGDPTPTDIATEYCELLFSIDKTSGQAAVELLER